MPRRLYLAMEGKGFEELHAYRRAVGLANVVHAAVGEWAPFDQWTAGIQMVRAVDSIGANLAEAYGRWGYADRRRLLFIARGSACELEHWLMVAKSRGLCVPEGAGDEAKEIGRMLNGLARAWRS